MPQQRAEVRKAGSQRLVDQDADARAVEGLALAPRELGGTWGRRVQHGDAAGLEPGLDEARHGAGVDGQARDAEEVTGPTRLST